MGGELGFLRPVRNPYPSPDPRIRDRWQKRTRKETDSELKLQAVRHLSMFHSDEAREFMLEILEED